MAQRDEKIVVSAGAGGLGAAIASESGTELGSMEEIKARGYWELVWRRFRRDKVAIGSGVFIILLIFFAFGAAPIVKDMVGHGPNDLFLYAPAVNLAGLPANPMTHVHNPNTGHSDLLVLGAANRLGQDELLRLMYGAQISLEVAILSTLGVMFIGVILGASAGYFRGWADTIIYRVTEITMAFPGLILVISLEATVGPRVVDLTLAGGVTSGAQ